MKEHDQPIPQGGQVESDAGTELASLPSLWDSVYGQQPGFIALVAGVRRVRLSGIQEAFYPWPGSVAKAASWVRWQAGQGKDPRGKGTRLRRGTFGNRCQTAPSRHARRPQEESRQGRRRSKVAGERASIG